MFTGIIQAKSILTYLDQKQDLSVLGFEFSPELLTDLKPGASVAIDGVCLTVVSIVDNIATFEVMLETLNRTTLGALQIGDSVNIERSAKIGDEIGGHLLSGHITSTAEIVALERPVNNYILTLEIAPQYMPFIMPKGYAALNGASLTIVDVDRGNNTFTIHLIPATLEYTTFSYKRVGDKINFEIDPQTQTIVSTVQQLFSQLTANNH